MNLDLSIIQSVKIRLIIQLLKWTDLRNVVRLQFIR